VSGRRASDPPEDALGEDEEFLPDLDDEAGDEEEAEDEGQRPDALVRPMRLTDVEEVHRIHCHCMALCLSDHYSADQVTAWMSDMTPLHFWAAQKKGQQFLVADLDGDVTGFAAWEENELCALFVLPDLHGQGLGSLLFTACAQKAADAQTPIERVHATLNAADYFRRFGFQPAGQSYELRRNIRIPLLSMVRRA
jgi:GNAT superfamily N-acetyltransferase